VLHPNGHSNRAVGSILWAPGVAPEDAYPAGGLGPTTPGTAGVAGDWTKARWGQVEAISIDISDNPVFDETGALVTAGWQDNMIGVRAEFHVGFIADDTQFVRLTGETPAA